VSAIKQPPALATLRYYLHYDPESGVFTWKECPPHRTDLLGKRAGYIASWGYRMIKLDGKMYIAHRLAWLYVTGQWPEQVNHIDGDKTNDRFANLRLADAFIAHQNMHKAKRNSKSGLLGVTTDVDGRRGFVASISADGKQHYLGHFKTAQEAHAAYIAAKHKLHPGWVCQREAKQQ